MGKAFIWIALGHLWRNLSRAKSLNLVGCGMVRDSSNEEKMCDRAEAVPYAQQASEAKACLPQPTER